MTRCECESGSGSSVICDDSQMAICIEEDGRCIGRCAHVKDSIKNAIILDGRYAELIGEDLDKMFGHRHRLLELDKNANTIIIKYFRQDGKIVVVNVSNFDTGFGRRIILRNNNYVER